MFWLIFLLLLFVFMPEIKWIFFVGIALIIVIIIISCFKKKHVRTEPHEYPQTETSNYKIGAEVGYSFFYEVKDYCYKHQMTTSDLIRKSVRAYMDANR